MRQLFETISVKDGIAQNIEYHQLRFEHSYRELWGVNTDISLIDIIKNDDKEMHYRAKFVYDKNTFCVTYYPYWEKNIKSLKIVNCNYINYHLKYVDRNKLDYLFEQRDECDDIIIVKNGLVTDTSIANLYFFDGSHWITPRIPLLEGTYRKKLITENKVHQYDILASNISSFERIAISNAMIGFRELNVFTKQQ